jgi:hypothetical protein
MNIGYRGIAISLALMAPSLAFADGCKKDCGRVASVQAVKQKGEGGAVGMIAGGVVGGLLAFGPVRLFIGPVILAITQVMLRTWVEGPPLPRDAAAPAPPTSAPPAPASATAPAVPVAPAPATPMAADHVAPMARDHVART